jgi:hypothetical protein
MADVETAVALCLAAAAKPGDDLLAAQSRLWAAEVALAVPARMLRLFLGSNLLDAAQTADLVAKADLPGAAALQAGTLADMDLVASLITAG